MGMKKYFWVFLLFTGACGLPPQPAATPTPQPPNAPFILQAEENPYAPQAQDNALKIGGVDITTINLLERFDLDPFRVEVKMLGSMPRVCNQLRVRVTPPNAQYQVRMEVYSLINPNIKCENVFQQFEAKILLGVYSTGRYTVWVNGGLVGDFVMY